MKEMKTLRLIVDPAHLETADAQQTLERAAQILRCGSPAVRTVLPSAE